MLGSSEYSELIIVGTAQGAVVPYSHACTFVAIDQCGKRHLAYCDCQGKDAEWYPEVPPTQTGQLLNFNDAFDNFWEMKVYCIQRERIDPKQAAFINHEMAFVMTGAYENLKA